MATSFLKKHLRSLQLLLAAALIFISTESQATIYYSRTTVGSFNLSILNNWTSNANGSGTNPSSTTDFTNGLNVFIVQNGNTVTCDGPLNCVSIRINQGGALFINNKSITTTSILLEGVLDLGINPSLATVTGGGIALNSGTANSGELVVYNGWSGLTATTGTFFTSNAIGNTVTFKGGTYDIPSINYPSLKIDGGSKNIRSNTTTINGNFTLINNVTLILYGSTITVGGDLSINNATIDFGADPSSLTVNGDLNGSATSNILQNGNIGNQTLTLKGSANTLGSYIANGNGASSVIYSGGSQSMFASANYKNLIVSGGSKTISGTTVATTLGIINTTITINNFDLKSDNISTSTATTGTGIPTGWVVTNGTGNLIKTSVGSNSTFPVGNATDVYPITMANVTANTAVRFGASTAHPSSQPIASSWFVRNNLSANCSTSMQVSIGSNTKIIEKMVASWQSVPTTYNASPTASISAPVTYGSTTKELSIYDCTISTTPTLSPANGATYIGLIGNTFSQQLTPSVASSTDTYTLSNTSGTSVPAWLTLSLNANGALLSATNPTAGTEIIAVTYSNNLCEVKNTYIIKITDLPSPNLFIFPIQSKTYGDADFSINSYSPSNGAITYNITNSCAQIIPNTNRVTITCAGPLPSNIVTITATQAATSLYKGTVSTQSFIISPKRSRLRLDKNTFILNTSDVITYTTNSDGIATFEQTSGTAATVLPNGSVTAISNGVFQVRISIPATNKYTAFDSIFTLTVSTLPQPPLVTRDTVSLEINEQVTFSILDNATGITSAIDLNGIDIDITNFGIQTGYYVTGLGNFELDQLGNCTYTSFGGFLGTDSIGYTVRDVNGLKSSVAYIVITIKSPVIIPPLQSNQIMTLNNDGANEALIIGYTNLDEENSITISDSNGNIIFEQNNYKNNWTGQSKNGKKLEPGIYYVVFTEKESGRSLYNYVQIMR